MTDNVLFKMVRTRGICLYHNLAQIKCLWNSSKVIEVFFLFVCLLVLDFLKKQYR